jgi:predicted RNA-binding protein Jag
LRQVEIQAFSVEEAVRLALEQLGRTRDQVNVEVLATDPGSEEVLVRVTAREQRAHAADEEVSPRERRPQPQPQPQGQAGRMGGQRDRDRDRGRPGGGGDRDRMRGGGRFDRGQGPPRRPSYEHPNLRTAPSPEQEYDEDDDTGNRLDVAVDLDNSLQATELAPGEHATPEDAIAPLAGEVLQKILMRMHIRGRIARRSASEEGEAAFPDDQSSVTLNITGLSERDQNMIVGRRGETLDALQFLVNLIVGRNMDLWTRVIIDVEGYRLRRKFALINLAKRTAEQVQVRNQAIPLEAMPAYERRIIHMTLSEHPSVVTESSGAEPERRVVVLPR